MIEEDITCCNCEKEMVDDDFPAYICIECGAILCNKCYDEEAVMECPECGGILEIFYNDMEDKEEEENE